jgi:hypothetical protein
MWKTTRFGSTTAKDRRNYGEQAGNQETKSFGNYLLAEFPHMIRRYSVGDVLQTHHLVYSGVKVGFITVYAEETLNIINCLFIFEQFRGKDLLRYVIKTLLDGDCCFHSRAIPFDSGVNHWKKCGTIAIDEDDEKQTAGLTADYERVGLRKCRIFISDKLFLTSG